MHISMASETIVLRYSIMCINNYYFKGIPQIQSCSRLASVITMWCDVMCQLIVKLSSGHNRRRHVFSIWFHAPWYLLMLYIYAMCRFFLSSLAYAVNSAQPLSGGIRSGVKSWQTTFKLIHWAVLYDVWYGLGVSTNAQWVVSVAPLVETGCTVPSARVEMVEKTPLTSGKVKTRDESCWVVTTHQWYGSLLEGQPPRFLSIIPYWRHCVCGPYCPTGF